MVTVSEHHPSQIISCIDRFFFENIRKCTEEELDFFPTPSQSLPQLYLDLLTRGIEQGNEIYRKFSGGKDGIVVYIDALKYTNKYAKDHIQESPPDDLNQKYFHSDDLIEVAIEDSDDVSLCEDIEQACYRFGKFALQESLLNREVIYFLIIARSRCILLSYRRSSKTFVLFDSHSHGPSTGAIIAFSRLTDLKAFSAWILRDIFGIQAKGQYAISSIHISTEPTVVQSEKIFLPRSSSSRSLSSIKSLTTSLMSLFCRPIRNRTSASFTDERSSSKSVPFTLQGSSCSFVRSKTTGNLTEGSFAYFNSTQSISGMVTGGTGRPWFYESDDGFFERIDMPSTSQSPLSTSLEMVSHFSQCDLDNNAETSEASRIREEEMEGSGRDDENNHIDRV